MYLHKYIHLRFALRIIRLIFVSRNISHSNYKYTLYIHCIFQCLFYLFVFFYFFFFFFFSGKSIWHALKLFTDTVIFFFRRTNNVTDSFVQFVPVHVTYCMYVYVGCKVVKSIEKKKGSIDSKKMGKSIPWMHTLWKIKKFMGGRGKKGKEAFKESRRRGNLT